MNQQTKAGLLVAGGLVLLVVFYVAIQPMLENMMATVEPFKETPTEKLAAMSEAFGDLPDGKERPVPNVPPGIATFFQSMQTAVNASDPAAYHEHFSFNDMLDVIDEQAPSLSTSSMSHRDVRTAIGVVLKSTTTTDMFAVQWNRFEIRKVDLFANGNQAVVYTLLPADDGYPVNFRWWLVRKSDKWLAYDYEQLDRNYRVTFDLANVNEAHFSRTPPKWYAHIDKLTEGANQVSSEDYVNGEAKLKSFLQVKMPNYYEGIRWFNLANAQVALDKYDEALKSLDMLDQYDPDMPEGLVLRTWAYAYSGQYEETIKAANAYAAMLGPQADVLYRKGVALSETERSAEALVAHIRCLKLHPNHQWNLYELVARHAELKTPVAEVIEQVRPAIFDFPDADALFGAIADELDDDYDLDALELLLAAWPPARPMSVRASYHAGKLAYRNENNAEAVRLLQPLVTNASASDAEEQNEIANTYLAAMAAQDKPLEAYDVVADKPVAFEYLADYLFDRRDTKRLDQLIDRHSRAHGGDAYVNLIKARTLILPITNRRSESETAGTDSTPAVSANELTQALAHLDRASQRIPQERDDLHENIRYYRVRVMVAQGQQLQALNTIKPQPETFRTLVNLAMQDDNNADLTELFDAHARKHPNDPWLHYYKGQAAMRLKQYEAAAQAFALAMKFDEDDSYNFRWNRAKAMYKLGQFMKAYDEIEPKGSTFATLAQSLAVDKNGKGLIQLSIKHMAAEPKDFNAHIQLANGYRLDKQHALADKTADGAVKFAENEYQKNRAFNLRVENRYDEGRWQSAFATFDDKKKVFDALKWTMSRNKKASELRELVSLYSEASPFWAAEADFIDGRYANALATLTARYDALTAGDEEKDVSTWVVNDRVIRAMVRLKKFVDAEAFIKDKFEDYDLAFFGTIVAANAGNVELTTKRMLSQIDSEEDWLLSDVLEEMYDDEDAGPALMSDAFAEFRKKYPKPAED